MAASKLLPAVEKFLSSAPLKGIVGGKDVAGSAGETMKTIDPGNGKTLAEFKEWVLANEFKSKPLTFETPHPAQGQSMKRDAFDKLSPHAQSDYCKNGGKITD